MMGLLMVEVWCFTITIVSPMVDLMRGDADDLTVKDSTDLGTPAMFGWNKLEFGSDGWPFVTTLSS